jgi:hypothetical protein
MHPLSTFSRLLDFVLVAPFLLRIIVGLYLIYLGKNRYQKAFSWSAGFYIISGILLILGFYTQIASIVGILLVIFDFYTDKITTPTSGEKKILYVIVGIILLSLLFTGPGVFAFDLPL